MNKTVFAVLMVSVLGLNSQVFAEGTPVTPTNQRVIYEGGQVVGKGSIEEYSERSGSSSRITLGSGSGRSYGTRIEVGTVYPDSYYYDDCYDCGRYPHRRYRDDYDRRLNRMRMEERRREVRSLSPNTNNELYNEVVTRRRMEERRMGSYNRDIPPDHRRSPRFRDGNGSRVRIEINR